MDGYFALSGQQKNNSQRIFIEFLLFEITDRKMKGMFRKLTGMSFTEYRLAYLKKKQLPKL